MAFTRVIEQNSDDSSQSSPAYLLTFTRFSNRDTLNYKDSSNLSVRKPLVVVNDAIQIQVNTAKNAKSPTFSCRLRAGDINYLTAIAPGDFVTVNMVNWEAKALELRDRALKLLPINRYEDGFKGVFKIFDVRMSLVVAPNGVKQYVYDVTGRAFDELETLIYFNPAIVDDTKKANPLFFLSSFAEDWKTFIQRKNSNNVQNLLKNLIKSTIGTGTKKTVKGDVPQNKIPRFELPPELGALLKRKGKKLYASDLYNYYLGIWTPKNNGKGKVNQKPEQGFNSFFEESQDGNFYDTGKGKKNELQGSRQIAVQDFQNVQAWSLLKNYSNPVLNETYATFRVAPDGNVYPSLVIRQKPFNNRVYLKSSKISPHTQFLDVPRWKISPNIITAFNIGRSNSARVNFIQVFTRSLSVDPRFDQAAQIEQENYLADEKDIVRNGMKPYIASCNFDYPNSDTEIKAREWALLVGDWLSNGHLKLNGQITSVGIEEPVCIGDNLEINRVVYQIESVNHVMSISADGQKNFRTTISLSMGIDERSTKNVPVYGEMEHTDTLAKRKDDYKNENMLPGFSDTQDILGRNRGEEIEETKQKNFTNPTSLNKGKK